MGVPPLRPDGVPPSVGGLGYNPPPVWTDTQTENITFPHPSDAGDNKVHESASRSVRYIPDPTEMRILP